MAMLTEDEAKELCEQEFENQVNVPEVQELIDDGAIPGLKGFQVKPGKVSDSIFGGYQVEDVEPNPEFKTKDDVPIRLMVRTTRISAGDMVRGKVPFKDQILGWNHRFMKELVQQYLGTSEFDIPGLLNTSPVTLAENLDMIMFENVIRLYNAVTKSKTSLYQAWKAGEKEFCGYQLPDELEPNGKLPELMFTPSTKAKDDKSVGVQYLYDQKVLNPTLFEHIKEKSTLAFMAAYNYALTRGLILFDTKLEHGRDFEARVKGQDEWFTLDSSRYVEEEEWKANKGKDIRLTEYSKEYARSMVDGDKPFTREQCIAIGARYIVAAQRLLNKPFEPDTRPRAEAIIEDTNKGLDYLLAA